MEISKIIRNIENAIMISQVNLILTIASPARNSRVAREDIVIYSFKASYRPRQGEWNNAGSSKKKLKTF